MGGGRVGGLGMFGAVEGVDEVAPAPAGAFVDVWGVVVLGVVVFWAVFFDRRRGSRYLLR